MNFYETEIRLGKIEEKLKKLQIDENLLARPAYATTSARSATEYAYDACPPQQPYPIRVNHYYANCVEQEDQDVYDVEAEAQEEEEEEEDEDEFYELQLGGKKQSEINYKNLFQFKSHFDVGGSPKPKYQLHVHEQSSSNPMTSEECERRRYLSRISESGELGGEHHDARYATVNKRSWMRDEMGVTGIEVEEIALPCCKQNARQLSQHEYQREYSHRHMASSQHGYDNDNDVEAEEDDDEMIRPSAETRTYDNLKDTVGYTTTVSSPASKLHLNVVRVERSHSRSNEEDDELDDDVDYDECIRKNNELLTLQDAFKMYKFDLILRSEQRLKNLKIKAEQDRLRSEMRMKHEMHRATSALAPSSSRGGKKPLSIDVTATTKKKHPGTMASEQRQPRFSSTGKFQHQHQQQQQQQQRKQLSQTDIKNQTNKVYKQLPEVRQKELDKKLNDVKRANRLKSAMFKKTIQKHVLQNGPNFNLNFNALKNSIQ